MQNHLLAEFDRLLGEVESGRTAFCSIFSFPSMFSLWLAARLLRHRKLITAWLFDRARGITDESKTFTVF